jgi:hypothetical protein
VLLVVLDFTREVRSRGGRSAVQFVVISSECDFGVAVRVTHIEMQRESIAQKKDTCETVN